MRHPLIGALTLFLFLILEALAVSPELHHLVHEDSRQEEHQCAVKLLSDDQVQIAPADINVPVAESLDLLPVARVAMPLLRPAFQLPPGRAPPLLSASAC